MFMAHVKTWAENVIKKTSFQDVFSGLIILMEILQIGFCKHHPICE
jgi:hypothetical protein